MKISPLLAALGGGAVGLGLSQGGLGGGALALSPMLAMLRKGKHGRDQGPAQGLPAASEKGAPVPGPVVAPPQAPPTPLKPQGHQDPRLAAMFQALAAQQQPPFGYR